MNCLICGKEQFDIIHVGTRDMLDISVLKCSCCGMVMLDNQSYNTKQAYSEGKMLSNSYNAQDNKVYANKTWITWINETERDDERRFQILKDLCAGKRVLEFGCGNGGFLKKIKNIAADVVGIELMDEARKQLNDEGISVYKLLSEITEKYDLVVMFMVIEHLNDPDNVLKEIYDHLYMGGGIICETVNADDALISKYKCKSFEDFTYWSEHVFLYNSCTLEKIFERNKFRTKNNKLLQRYTLANHLYWLSQGLPGGHMKWIEFNDEDLNKLYSDKLIELGIADTLWYEGIKY